MQRLKPKEWHEQFLANADKKKILQSLEDGETREIMKVAVDLARQCALFTEFVRLWTMRVADLEENLSTQQYMKHVYVNKRTLYKELRQDDSKS